MMAGMRLLLAVAFSAVSLFAGDTLEVFGHKWTVPVQSDWQISKEGGREVLRLAQHRGPLPGPRRPIQFALLEGQPLGQATVELDLKPLNRSCIIVYAYRDEAHFNYAHLSLDTGTKQPVHNGVFHVYGGERVRISDPSGPPAFPEIGKWYHVVLRWNGRSGEVRVSVDGHDVPALHAVDLSLHEGRIGLGSFDETGEFKNVKVTGAGS